MPAKWFICPDGQWTKINECYEKCRMHQRCMTIETLMEIGRERKWTGVPSVTQLLKGTRQAYLEIRKDYAIDPQDQAFSLLGTKHHLKLEKNLINTPTLLEVGMSEFGISGIADHYDAESQILTDYKTSGSYKVAKVVGIVKITREEPILRPDGTPLILKSGKNKGKPKTRKITSFEIRPETRDGFDWDMQLNMYRIFFERAGFKVKKMQIQATVRDGGTYIAKQRGIDKNIYLIPIPFINDNDVIIYFKSKADDLLWALQNEVMPYRCSDYESWKGRRCENYCPVSAYCSHYEETGKEEDLFFIQ